MPFRDGLNLVLFFLRRRILVQPHGKIGCAFRCILEDWSYWYMVQGIDRRWSERFSAKAIDVVRVHSYVFRFALNRMNSDVENELK